MRGGPIRRLPYKTGHQHPGTAHMELGGQILENRQKHAELSEQTRHLPRRSFWRALRQWN